MEAKRPRAAAIAALCMLLLLALLPGQVAAKSEEYYICFDHCFLRCRDAGHTPPRVCSASCADMCTIETNKVGDGAATCRMACKTVVPAAGICARNCNRKWSRHKHKAN